MAGKKLSVGKKVRIEGLQGRNELNGKIGVIMDVREGEQFSVKLDEGTEIVVKAANLALEGPEGCHAAKDAKESNKAKRARFAEDVIVVEDFAPQASGGAIDAIQTESEPDEDEAEDSSDPPYSTHANKAVKIRLIRDKSDPGICFNLEKGFTHQIFFQESQKGGEVEKIHEELIIGYVNPRVEVVYASGSLKPWFDFKFDGKEDARELRRAGLTCSNVIKSVESATRFCDYARMIGAVHAEADSPFTPPGRRLSSCPAPPNLLPPAGGGRADGGGDGGGRLEVFACTGNQTEAIRLALRLQTFVIWLIECGCCIELPDERWHILTLYHAEEMGGRTVYCLVGFLTAYRYWAYDKVRHAIDRCRIRVSQCAVLPPFQRRGMASKLLQAVYGLVREDEAVLDVTVEDPSPDFQAMRDVVDLELLISSEGLAALLSAATDGKEALAELGRRYKLCARQMRRMADAAAFLEAGLTDPNLDPEAPAPAALPALRRRIKRRLYGECLMEAKGVGLVEDDGQPPPRPAAAAAAASVAAAAAAAAEAEAEAAGGEDREALAAARVWGPGGEEMRRRESLRTQFADLFRCHATTAARVARGR